MSKYLRSYPASACQERLGYFIFVLGIVFPCAIALAEQPTTRPGEVRIEGRSYQIATLVQSIQGKLGSESKTDKLRGMELAGLAGKALAGSAVVAQLEIAAEKVDEKSNDIDLKRSAVLALEHIDDDRSKKFAIKQLKSSDDFISFVSASYLSKRMYKDDADAVVSALIRVSGIDDNGLAAAQSIPWGAFSTLSRIAKRYGLPLAEDSYVRNPKERVSMLKTWWQTNRQSLLDKLPTAPPVPANVPKSQPAGTGG